MKRGLVCIYANTAALLFLAAYLSLLPLLTIVHDLRDPALRTGGTPRLAFRWHRALSADYEDWARERVASGQAKTLNTYDISGTEWPMFGSVFYLWATEALQEAWEADPGLAPTMPAEYARGAIEAAASLVADPGNAAWVRAHWGDDYLTQENLFYRTLLISGLTGYQHLLKDDRYEPLLQQQVTSLAIEIDRSPYGLVDDYPGECYPIDVLPAIAAIQRADQVLGTDHGDFVARAIRAFEGERLDPRTDLPPFAADSRTGRVYGSARGVGVFMLIWMPELWPEEAEIFYDRFEIHFWQPGDLVSGFREYPHSISTCDWWFWDVDAGPILAGYGTAASAFGIGAARANGRLDHGYPLSAEALVASWPLPDGTLLGPRMVSDLTDAPYVGEAALLFSLTRTPVVGSVVAGDGPLPRVVWMGLAFYALQGGVIILWALGLAWRWRRPPARSVSIAAAGLWGLLLVAGLLALLAGRLVIALLLMVLAQSVAVIAMRRSR